MLLNKINSYITNLKSAKNMISICNTSIDNVKIIVQHVISNNFFDFLICEGQKSEDFEHWIDWSIECLEDIKHKLDRNMKNKAFSIEKFFNKLRNMSPILGKFIPYIFTDNRLNDVDTQSSSSSESSSNESFSDILLEGDYSRNRSNFKGFRDNQTDAIITSKNNDFQTGIHCQATGTGKTFIGLKLCNEYTKKYPNKNIVWFTERKNIMTDLFYNYNEDWKINKRPKYEMNLEAYKMWKHFDIFDITKYNFKEFVTDKDKKWYKKINIPTDKPKFILINRTFLTMYKKYKKIDDDNYFGLIIHDECHSSVNNTTYPFLIYSKEKGSKIIGFSATPLRYGKTKKIDNKTRLMDIFKKENEDKLNILTCYNIKNSIELNYIVKPKFYWFKINEKNKKIINNNDFDVIMKLLNDIVPTLPYAKIISWCRRKDACNNWEIKFNEHKNKYSNLMNMLTFVDHTGKSEDERNKAYISFRNFEKNGILFCAGKHREGSDIPNLDSCIFLDKVKNRGSLPFIQCFGRTLRKDKNELKTQGVIIDGYLANKNNVENLIDKIIGYYINFETMAMDNLTSADKFNTYVELLNRTSFDVNSNMINIRLNERDSIEIQTNNLDWLNISSHFDRVLQKRLSMSKDDKFKIIIYKLKSKFCFNLYSMKYRESYNAIPDDIKVNHNIPLDIYKEYPDKFETQTWYDILEIDITSWYSTIEECVYNIQENEDIDQTLMDDNYYYEECINIDIKLPYDPYEYFRFNHFTNIKDKFGTKKTSLLSNSNKFF